VVANNAFYVLNTSNPATPYFEGSATLQNGPGNIGSVTSSIAATSSGSVAYVVNQGVLNVVAIP
jgi:hypothetical protein